MIRHCDVMCALTASQSANVFIYRLRNPLQCRGNYSATSNDIKSVHWLLMGGLLHLVQRGGDWAGPQPAQTNPCCTKCNMYNGPLPCGFNVPIKGFTLYPEIVVSYRSEPILISLV